MTDSKLRLAQNWLIPEATYAKQQLLATSETLCPSPPYDQCPMRSQPAYQHSAINSRRRMVAIRTALNN